jgi:hypothetical protein
MLYELKGAALDRALAENLSIGVDCKIMVKKNPKNVLSIRRVVRVDLKDKLDSRTILLLTAYQEWHKTQTGEEVSLGEAIDAAVSEQVNGLSGFRAFFKEFETRNQVGDGDGARRSRRASTGDGSTAAGAGSATGASGGASAGAAK